MKTIYYFLISIILFGIMNCNEAQAQATYGYDASGNRISRVITIVSKAPAQPQQQSEDTLQSQPQSTEEPAEQKVFNEMLKDFTVRIYPNPTKGDFTVEIQQLPEGKTATLRLYSASGKLIHHKNGFRGGAEHFNISHHPNGIYILRIVAGDSSTEWKIIKQ